MTLGKNSKPLSLCSFLLAFSLITIEIRYPFGFITLSEMIACLFIIIFIVFETNYKGLKRLNNKNVIYGLLIIFMMFLFDVIATNESDMYHNNNPMIGSRLTAAVFLAAGLLVSCSRASRENFYIGAITSLVASGVVMLLVSTGKLFLPFGRYERFLEIEIYGMSLTRNAGLIFDYGDLAVISAFTIPCCLYYFRALNFYRFLLVFIYFISLVAVAIISQSRNVVVSVAVTVFLIAIGRTKFSLKVASLSTPLFLLIIALVLNDVTDYFQAVRVDSIIARVAQYEYAFSNFWHSLFQPGGLTSTKMHLEYAVHNALLSSILMAGFPGLIFVMFLCYFVIANLRVCLSAKGLLRNTYEYRIMSFGFIGWFCAIQFYPAQVDGTAPVWLILGFYLGLMSPATLDSNQKYP